MAKLSLFSCNWFLHLGGKPVGFFVQTRKSCLCKSKRALGEEEKPSLIREQRKCKMQGKVTLFAQWSKWNAPYSLKNDASLGPKRRGKVKKMQLEQTLLLLKRTIALIRWHLYLVHRPYSGLFQFALLLSREKKASFPRERKREQHSSLSEITRISVGRNMHKTGWLVLGSAFLVTLSFVPLCPEKSRENWLQNLGQDSAFAPFLPCVFSSSLARI